MPTPVVTSYSRLFPLAVDAAFDRLLPAPLPTIFARRVGPIPPIKAVEGQDGVWGTAGQTRTIRMSDGGSMREELTTVDRPNSFGYTISGITGPMRPLVAGADGLWSFEQVGAQTRITWQWTISPRSALVAPIMPVFCRIWRAYAAKSFDTIATVIA